VLILSNKEIRKMIVERKLSESDTADLIAISKRHKQKLWTRRSRLKAKAREADKAREEAAAHTRTPAPEPTHAYKAADYFHAFANDPRATPAPIPPHPQPEGNLDMPATSDCERQSGGPALNYGWQTSFSPGYCRM
jgi:hypothetical protein